MSALAGKRILVAEDNALLRRALCEMLGAHGATAVPAQDGEEAVRLFAASMDGAFDAALMDVSMPGMDGYAAARAIRRMDRRVLIFAHTDAGTQYGAGNARESGMDACLQKPVRMRELSRLLAAGSGIG